MPTSRTANLIILTADTWQSPPPGVAWYRCPVWLVPEAEGGFSVLAATLPGAVSEGETEEEALAMIREALAAVLSVYRLDGVEPPWRAEIEACGEAGAYLRWVVVRVEEPA